MEESNTIKAIDTYYNGNYFRSRLEARWAVFFDELGILYQYEPQGYKTSAGYYLPDFYLPGLGCYCEVKPNLCLIDEHEDYKKWLAFIDEGMFKLLLLWGNPHNRCLRLLLPKKHLVEYEGDREYDYGWKDGENTYKRLEINEYRTQDVGFHFETKTIGKSYWRFWGSSGEEEFDGLLNASVVANKKRFEHNAA